MGAFSRFHSVRQAVDWARKEGFRVALVRCRVCGFTWVAIFDPANTPDTLECSVCGSTNSAPVPPTPADPRDS